jgi:phosphoserine phosphatase
LRREERFSTGKLACYLSLIVARKIGLIDLARLKELGIRIFLSNRTRDALEKYGKNFAKQLDLSETYHKSFVPALDGERAVVVSASFDIYLKYLFPEEALVASEIEFGADRKPKGMSFHCYGQRKVERLRERGIDMIDILYTDSPSDLALATMAQKIVLVKGDTEKEYDSLDQLLRCNRSWRNRAGQ